MLCEICKIQTGTMLKEGKLLCSYCFDTNNSMIGLHQVQRRYQRIDRDLAVIESLVDKAVERGDYHINPMKTLNDLKHAIHLMRRSLYMPIGVRNLLIAKFKLPADSKFINVDDEDIPRQKRKKITFTCDFCSERFISKSYQVTPKFCSKKCFKAYMMRTVDVSLLDRTAEVLSKIKDEDLELLEQLRS